MAFGSSGPRRFTRTREVSFEAGGRLYGPWLTPLLCMGASWPWAGLKDHGWDHLPPCGLALHRPAGVVHRAVLGGEQSSRALKVV